MADEKLMDRARDELFSHINRCGVLTAEPADQRTWMDETIEYIAERYPDVSDADVQGLHSIGIRFCQPAIAYGNPLEETVGLIKRSADSEELEAEQAEVTTTEPVAAASEPVPATAEPVPATAEPVAETAEAEEVGAV